MVLGNIRTSVSVLMRRTCLPEEKQREEPELGLLWTRVVRPSSADRWSTGVRSASPPPGRQAGSLLSLHPALLLTLKNVRPGFAVGGQRFSSDPSQYVAPEAQPGEDDAAGNVFE